MATRSSILALAISIAALSAPATAAEATPTPSAPTLTDLRQAHPRFTARRGTTFSFRLDRVATVTATFYRVLPGLLAEGTCGPPRDHGLESNCKRFLRRGELTRAGHPGGNHIRFVGRVQAGDDRPKALAPGTYLVEFRARNAAGRSAAALRTFRIAPSGTRPSPAAGG